MIQTKQINGVLTKLTAAISAIVMLVAFGGTASAAHLIRYTEVPFTQAELDDNWLVDRAVPSGGFGSVSYEGRNDVLEMNIDGTNRSTISGFYYTEGLQRELADADAVRGDLYIESSWLDHDVRAGMWGVGNDMSDEVSAYPITEFTTAGADDFTGWRVWDGVLGGWTNLPDVTFNADGWNDVRIVLNAESSMFDHYVNGELVASTTAGGSSDLGAVILNSFNYGSDATDYSVHWSSFAIGVMLESPTDKKECKKGGWVDFGFRNQGQCIRFVNTGQDSR